MAKLIGKFARILFNGESIPASSVVHIPKSYTFDCDKNVLRKYAKVDALTDKQLLKYCKLFGKMGIARDMNDMERHFRAVFVLTYGGINFAGILADWYLAISNQSFHRLDHLGVSDFDRIKEIYKTLRNVPIYSINLSFSLAVLASVEKQFNLEILH